MTVRWMTPESSSGSMRFECRMRKPATPTRSSTCGTPKGGDRSEGAGGREVQGPRSSCGAGQGLSEACGREGGLQEGTAGPVASSCVELRPRGCDAELRGRSCDADAAAR
eukprot:6141809-Prymnesium_polylepis.1